MVAACLLPALPACHCWRTRRCHEGTALLLVLTCRHARLLPARSEDVNIIIVMRAMGVESDEEVLQLVGTEAAFANLLIPTLQHCKEEGVYTRQQALDYLASKVKSTSRPGGPGGGPGGAFQRRTRSKVDEAREILANVVLCHVPVVHFDYQQKVGAGRAVRERRVRHGAVLARKPGQRCAACVLLGCTMHVLMHHF